MKFLLLLICVHLIWIECTSIPDTDDTILLYENHPYNGIDGGYSFEYITRDRQTRKEEGVFVRTADDNVILRVIGYYKFVGTDGKNRLVTYESDENGYRQNVTILMKRTMNRIHPNALKSLIG